MSSSENGSKHVPNMLSFADKPVNPGELLSSTLPFPDHSIFTVIGDMGRLKRPKPKSGGTSKHMTIFSPLFIIFGARSDATETKPDPDDMIENVRNFVTKYLGIPSINVIDILKDSFINGQWRVTLTGVPTGFVSPEKIVSDSMNEHYNISLIRYSDSLQDDDFDRREEIKKLLAANTRSDSLIMVLPVNWLVPLSTFVPKCPTIPLFPDSHWNSFMSNFGAISKSYVLFASNYCEEVSELYPRENRLNENCEFPGGRCRTQPESFAGLLVKYRSYSSLQQGLLHLHRRYLVHPDEANGMTPAWVKPVNYEATLEEARTHNFRAKDSLDSSHELTMRRDSRIPFDFPIHLLDPILRAAVSYSGVMASSLGVHHQKPSLRATVSQLILRLSKLESENQKLLLMNEELRSHYVSVLQANEEEENLDAFLGSSADTQKRPVKAQKMNTDGSNPPWRK